jgi:hypothetical protein
MQGPEPQNIAQTAALIGIFIPIVAILGGYIAAVFGIRNGLKKKQLKHEERMAMIAKGTFPEEPPEKSKGKEKKPVIKVSRRFDIEATLRRGIVTAAVGFGWFVAFVLFIEEEAAGLGLIPAFIGVGLVIYYFIARNELPKYGEDVT